MFTQTDIINLRLKLARQNYLKTVSDFVILKSLIESDKASKEKKEMREGEDYYEGYHKISFRKIYYWIKNKLKEDKTRANRKATNVFFQDHVDHKADFIAGNPIVISSTGDNETENKKFEGLLKELLGTDFNDILNDWIKGASSKGLEWMHFYLDEDGNFNYQLISARQIIPIYETQYEKKLEAVIRYYTIKILNDKNEEVDRIKAEWWTSNQVTYFIETEKGEYELDTSEEINPSPHWVKSNRAIEGSEEGESWTRPPFVPLLNNSRKINDLRRIKSLIDIYDLVESDWANNLEDVQDVVYILKGYEGTSMDEFITNLKKYKAIKISPEEGSGVDSIRIEIPYESRKNLLELIRQDIYHNGSGVDMSVVKIGTAPSGVALKFLYGKLNIKANGMIRKLEKALTEFMWFVSYYINLTDTLEFKPENLSYIFNKGMPVNELENSQIARNSKGIISDETILENHSWVKDADEEKKRLEDQRAQQQEAFNIPIDEEDEE